MGEVSRARADEEQAAGPQTRGGWRGLTVTFAELPLAYRLLGEAMAVTAALLLGSATVALCRPGIAPAIVNKDFANYWLAAHLAAAGHVQDVFGPEPVYLAWLHHVFGPQVEWRNWSYPPHYLLLMMGLALLPYKAGLLLFLFVTAALFWRALRSFCTGLSSLRLVIVAAPFMLVNIWVAQNGFLTAALALFALRYRAERPVVAGLCLGLLTVKPQLGFLLPLVMLAEGRWRVLAVAALTTGLSVALSALLFGPAVWHSYIAFILPYQGRVAALLDGVFLTMLPSTYGAARLYGLPAATALILHGLVAIPAAIITVAAIFATRSPAARVRIALTATFLITPYALSYDLGLLTAAVASYLADGADRGRRLDQAVMMLALLLPQAMMIGAVKFGVAIAPPVLILTFALMLCDAGAGDALTAWCRRVGLSAPPAGRAGAGAARSA